MNEPAPRVSDAEPADPIRVAPTLVDPTLLDLIRSRVAEIEAGRRLPADLSEAIARRGLFRLCVPRAIGGLESAPQDFAAAIETVARVDGSTAWCLMIGATSGLVSGYLAPEAARAVFATPTTLTGAVFAPRGRAEAAGDGYRVTGRWSWGSGIANCQWMMAGCVVSEGGAVRSLPNGAPDPHLMIAPIGAVTVHDTWHVAGLRGTGSQDFELDDVAVPAERAVSLLTTRPVAGGALYAFPLFGLLAVGVAAVTLGIARGAIDEVIALSGQRVPMGSQRVAAERPAVQAALARAEADWRAARAFLREAIDRAWEDARGGGTIGLERRRDLRLAASHAAQTARAVTATAFEAGGGASVYETNGLARRLRDVQVANQHMMVQPPTFEVTGRLLLGLKADTWTL